MYLTRHNTQYGSRWAVDGNFLPQQFNLGVLLGLRAAGMIAALEELKAGLSAAPEAAAGELLAPVDAGQEIWASGVTYLRSRDARVAESQTANIYERVYDAERPELFFKANGSRAVGHGQAVRVRPDSAWNVPEPEAVLVINRYSEIVGFCAGNDLSSRSIEAENPLYLPQAKIYDGACALGPGIRLMTADAISTLQVSLAIRRGGQTAFQGATSLKQMKRRLSELVDWLFGELSFPLGVLLFTGTGIVPPDDFSLQPGDRVMVTVGDLTLENPVA